MIVAVIPAAGTSSRLGMPKQLLDLGGKPLLQHAVERAARHFERVVVVVGHEEERVRAALWALPDVEFVANPDYLGGQQTSVRAGLAAVPRGADAAVLLGDQPAVPDELIEAVVAGFNASDAAVVRPRHGGAPGHPVLVRAAALEGINEITSQQLRALLRGPDVVWIERPDPPPADVDTWESYERLGGRAPG